MIITHKKYNSMPEQVQENMNNISKLNKQTVQTIEQELTDEEKAQARENLGIIGQSKISSINFDYGEQLITYDTEDGITIHSNSLLTGEDQESYSFDSERNIPIISSEEVVFDATEDNKHVKAYLENTISNKINNSLQIPMSTPSEIKIVGVDTSKSQILINKSDLIQCNPNLLINGDFKVNQRGQTNYPFDGDKYCVDRWEYIGAPTQGSIDVLNNGIRWNISGTGSIYDAITQKIEQDFSDFVGKNITASINCQITGESVFGVRLNFYSDFFQTQISATYSQLNNGLNTFTTTIPNGTKYIKFSYRINSNSGSGTFTINNCKLELGSVATPFSPRPYAEELAMCQRYYQKLYLQGTAFFPNSTSTGYPAIQTTQIMRNPITISVLQNANVRGYGTVKDIDSLTYHAYLDNKIRLLATRNNSDLVGNQTYVFATGQIAVDSEIY